MATEKTTKNSELTVKERKEYFDKQALLQEKFQATKQALQLLDLTKTESRTFTTFSKSTLRNYMKNPKANEKNLRALSRFLYRLSYSYRRLIQYNAEMIDLTALSIIPLIDITTDNDEEKVLKNYYTTLTKVEQMNLAEEIYKLLVIAWREDTVYGYVYDDDTDFFIHILDGDYCKVSSIEGGVFNFAFDFSYFSKHEADLEYWDSEFQSMYNTYKSDNKMKWQELNPERTICFKVNVDDPTMDYPNFAPLFESIIDLIDLQSIQSVKDELSIYKLLVARLDTLQGADEADDFSVDIDTAIEYYNKLAETLPDCVGSAISPLKIEPIEFKPTDASDTDMISTSTANLFKQAGGSQILNNDKTGTSITEAQIMCDTEMAISSLLPQIQKWMNRYLSFVLGDDHAKIKYMEVSPYTKEKKKKQLLESGNNGVPVKLAIASLDGFSPLETLSLDFLENTVLKLHETWIPLSTSYTQSGDNTDPVTGGRPTSDTGDLTDDGEASREKADKA